MCVLFYFSNLPTLHPLNAAASAQGAAWASQQHSPRLGGRGRSSSSGPAHSPPSSPHQHQQPQAHNSYTTQKEGPPSEHDLAESLGVIVPVARTLLQRAPQVVARAPLAKLREQVQGLASALSITNTEASKGRGGGGQPMGLGGSMCLQGKPGMGAAQEAICSTTPTLATLSTDPPALFNHHPFPACRP